MDSEIINKVIYFLLDKDHYLPYAWIQSYGNDNGAVDGLQVIIQELKRLKVIESRHDRSGHEEYLLTLPSKKIINNLPFAFSNKPHEYFLHQENKKNAVTEEILELELDKLRNEFKDYPITRTRANEAHMIGKKSLTFAKRSMRISLISLLILLITILLSRYKVWPFDK